MFARSAPELVQPAEDQEPLKQPAAPADLDKLKKYFAESAYKTADARAASLVALDFYDGVQYTGPELKALNERLQPPIVTNRIKPSINGIIGVIERGRSDPRALPRNPGNEEAADAATDVLRYIADFNSRVGTVEGAYGDSYARGEWSQWSSWNRETFRCRTAAVFHETNTPPGGNQSTFVGDDTTGEVWEMKVGAWTDGGPGGFTGLESATSFGGLEATPITALEATILPSGDPLIRQASAFIKIEEGRPRMDALVLHCVTGVGNAIAPGNLPLVEMRWSDDLGRTWSRWRAAPLGAQGDYGARAHWQRLGLMRAPGRLIQVRCSEPVDVAFSHLELNPLRAAQ